MKRRLLLFLLPILWCCPPSLAVEPEIDPGLQQSLEGDAGLDVESTEGGGMTQPGVELLPDGTVEIDEEVLQRQREEIVDDFIPALLTLERRVQFSTACQYWVKLENRLPFKIRNMALRFTTYLKNDSYDRPVVFDSEVRSFSELRPTDSQYRNIFYEHVDCADLNFIKVEDAGRCSMGALTKFSAQSGECAKYVEVQPSDLICIYLDDGSYDAEGGEPMAGGRSKRNPCGIVSQYDVDQLLMKMIQAYDSGDLEGFAALFSSQVQSNEERGLESLKSAFPDLFQPVEGSRLKLGNVSWKSKSGGSAAIWLSFRLSGGGEQQQAAEKTFRVAMRASMNRGQLLITHFLHEER